MTPTQLFWILTILNKLLTSIRHVEWDDASNVFGCLASKRRFMIAQMVSMMLMSGLYGGQSRRTWTARFVKAFIIALQTGVGIILHKHPIEIAKCPVGGIKKSATNDFIMLIFPIHYGRVYHTQRPFEIVPNGPQIITLCGCA
jgi:hypothetical protein